MKEYVNDIKINSIDKEDTLVIPEGISKQRYEQLKIFK